MTEPDLKKEAYFKLLAAVGWLDLSKAKAREAIWRVAESEVSSRLDRDRMAHQNLLQAVLYLRGAITGMNQVLTMLERIMGKDESGEDDQERTGREN